MSHDPLLESQLHSLLLVARGTALPAEVVAATVERCRAAAVVVLRD